MHSKLYRRLGQCLILAGTVGLMSVGGAYVHAFLGFSSAVAAFERAAAEQVSAGVLTVDSPDKSNWSEQRMQAFDESAKDAGIPIALLEIDRLGMQVPVFPGTDRVTLNRGAGIVDGTAYPGERGNTVLSAHRDGFFRALKGVREGDQLRVRTLEGVEYFVVKETFITDPLDISVLDSSDARELTLVTCYPFYFVGFAPERFIVRAELVTTVNATGGRASSKVPG